LTTEKQQTEKRAQKNERKKNEQGDRSKINAQRGRERETKDEKDNTSGDS